MSQRAWGDPGGTWEDLPNLPRAEREALRKRLKRAERAAEVKGLREKHKVAPPKTGAPLGPRKVAQPGGLKLYPSEAKRKRTAKREAELFNLDASSEGDVSAESVSSGNLADAESQSSGFSNRVARRHFLSPQAKDHASVEGSVWSAAVSSAGAVLAAPPTKQIIWEGDDGRSTWSLGASSAVSELVGEFWGLQVAAASSSSSFFSLSEPVVVLAPAQQQQQQPRPSGLVRHHTAFHYRQAVTSEPVPIDVEEEVEVEGPPTPPKSQPSDKSDEKPPPLGAPDEDCDFPDDSEGEEEAESGKGRGNPLGGPPDGSDGSEGEGGKDGDGDRGGGGISL
uniref:Uncharacterized protein n=1 Tax=Chromera velia CCMP2878 TaxID=1169474 RepID=A0A0G4HAE8_9ALVE